MNCHLVCTLLSCSVALIGVFSSTVQSADWPQFRGANGIGVSAEKDIPTTWDDGANVLWKAELPGAGASSPIALGNRLYITCYSGYGVDDENSGEMDSSPKDGRPSSSA